MRGSVAAVLVIGLLSVAEQRENGRNRKVEELQTRQTEVDEMVNGVLQWLQTVYSQKNRKARQFFGGKPERPRPFEPASYLPPPTGYPPAGSRPTPAFPAQPPSGPTYQPPQTSYQPPRPAQPPYRPSQPTYQPSQPQPTNPPTQPTYQPSQPTYQPPQPTNPPSYNPEPETQPPYSPSNEPETQPPYNPGELPAQPSYNPSTSPPYNPTTSPPYNPPTSPPYNPSTSPPYNPSTSPPYNPSTSPPYNPSTSPTYNPSTSPPYNPSTSPSYNPSTSPPYNPSTNPSYGPSTDSPNQVPSGSENTDEDRHPPHIHAITVDCGKQQMTINIEFNKPYNGLIYSQGFFNMPDCVYVRENSNEIKFSFTVNLEMCGTKFYSDFENEGQAYLENVLVLQNEVGIQEVWDHIRRVRCLWEGNLTKQLVSSLSVGMLNQITSNFSGDTAMARLDIQMGRGPFAPEANGLVKIGEVMTLVISVTGDPGFDIQVKQCLARDANNNNMVPLTDENGCVLKPKLFGAFQKSRDTGNTGASILAYAFFNAFKFPDEMDLILQCDVELCKTDCDMCPNPGSIDPARRKRDVILIGNSTLSDPVTVGKGLRVIFPEDLQIPDQRESMCVSHASFLWGVAFILLVTMTSSVTAGYFWLKMQKYSVNK